MGDNAYQIDLPSKYGVSTSFIVVDLTPFCARREEEPRLMDQPSQDEGIDEAIEGNPDPEELLVGPRTQSQEQRIERSLSNLFQPFFDTNEVWEEGLKLEEKWVNILKQSEESGKGVGLDQVLENWAQSEEGKTRKSIDRP